ncbi:MAG: HAMP domain-containing histidine kinase, partial [Lachnospiraceae bacterium]|nr:HAMP domain-containing histidine kinase [Lachnospiraceae bacterium]
LTAVLAWIDRRAGIIMAAAGVWFIIMFLMHTKKRYASINELTTLIDRVLHGNAHLDIGGSKEGELAVLESEVQKMTLRLREQADRLSAEKVKMSNALADIAHQIRTPLTSMNLTVSMLSDEDLSYESRVNCTRSLKRSLAKTDWLIEALLKMSKIDAGTAVFKKERVSVKELIRKAAEPLLIAMELKGQEFIVNAADETFEGDESWSIEAVGNLIKNASEHTPAGGRIEVTAGENNLSTDITVKDNGEGFAEKDIPRLFERFYKGKNASPESIGIGLALARSIVMEQNGTITAKNAPEGGAMFVIKFYKSVL